MSRGTVTTRWPFVLRSLFAIDMVKRADQFCLFWLRLLQEPVGPLPWSRLCHVGFAEARAEAMRMTNKVELTKSSARPPSQMVWGSGQWRILSPPHFPRPLAKQSLNACWSWSSLKKRLLWLDGIKGNHEENAGIPSFSFKDNNRKTGIN